MRRFDEILDLAAERLGGRDTLERILTETRPLAPQEIAVTPDDRILAAMTRRIFCAGFSSKVIDAKWEAFESAFQEFDPSRCAWMAATLTGHECLGWRAGQEKGANDGKRTRTHRIWPSQFACEAVPDTVHVHCRPAVFRACL